LHLLLESSFNLIEDRICRKNFNDDPKTILIIQNDSGMVLEYYYSCKSILITYLVVGDKSRDKGLAKNQPLPAQALK